MQENERPNLRRCAQPTNEITNSPMSLLHRWRKMDSFPLTLNRKPTKFYSSVTDFNGALRLPQPRRRLVVYIDGESHFLRSEKAWSSLHSGCDSLEEIYPRQGGPPILLDKRSKVFWSQLFSPGAHRVAYFSAFSGDTVNLHNIRKSIREFGLEPNLYHEPGDLRNRRNNALKNDCLIEKAKQVDIGLAIRAIQDAYADVFDECHIYTSDIDFIPLIQALKARGPTVKVFGYKNGLGNLSSPRLGFFCWRHQVLGLDSLHGKPKS